MTEKKIRKTIAYCKKREKIEVLKFFGYCVAVGFLVGLTYVGGMRDGAFTVVRQTYEGIAGKLPNDASAED